ncbi:NnrS family protein [Paracoccus sp. (in: a-proteobacteria)]|uniref:NnrS family protein n=1 Tax=Paracoccus sp. TaxID=267 RepID=UPI0026E0B94F|nr:NnrS family protein [Paracoccus sp. (in: a-proteobacteria)]MDO5371092.1 NnrS family protein [Paracoccus sp. (in: a-proteobacteria)]
MTMTALNASPAPLPIIFRDGWRVFFMAAGLYALAAIAVWLCWTSGVTDLPFGPGPVAWHAHEMVFGFATAALGGFFLTAVPNWTGGAGPSDRFVALVAGLWLAGRVAVWFSGALPAGLVALVDLAFIPVLGARMVAMLMAKPKPQNLMFIVLLTLVWLSNLAVHLDWMGWTETEGQGMRGGLLTVSAMIAILGGRVTPAFTRNSLLRADPAAAPPVSRTWFDVAGIVLAILTAVLALAAAPQALTGAAALAAGIAAALRLSGWRTRATLGDPILWALHAGYGMLALGLAVWGLALLGLGSEVAGLHILGIGAIGGMTLAVMSRASIGHSGRPLRAPATIALGYALMPLAAGLRWAASTWPGAFHDLGTLGAGLLWIVAFTFFLVALWPIWTTPRPARGAA